MPNPASSAGLRARLRSATALVPVRAFVLGAVLGATLLGARPSSAASFDYGYVLAQAQWVYSQVTSNLGNMITSMSDRLTDQWTRGVDQLSRYMKGQVEAEQQIEDASNMANARFQRDVRNAEIRDEHVPTLASCLAQQRGNQIVVAAGQSAVVGATLAAVGDARLQGRPGTPANLGATQVLAAANARHIQAYCDALDVEAGLCQEPSPRLNEDQSATSLFGRSTYQTQQDVEAAHDFIQTLTAPLPPPAIRGDARSSPEGQERMALRRGYNARISLAQWASTNAAATRTRAVAMTSEQRAEWQRLATARGDTSQPPTNISLSEAIDLEVSRRMGNPDWAQQLEEMPPASVARETARLLALNAWINWQGAQRQQVSTSVLGSLLAIETERDERMRGVTTFPGPSVAAR